MSDAGRQRGILLTGATGLVGAELLGRLLARHPAAEVHCLIRASDAGALAERLREVRLLARLTPATARRVHAIAGDVARPGLGLGDAFEPLARRVDTIVHAAASTRFDADLASARAVNLRSVIEICAFAQRARASGGLARLLHVSTAYVCGDRPGLIEVHDADRPGRFRNAYEQSKHEAELALRERATGLPWVIARPSIIVGDSRDGRTPHFRVLYEPMKWIATGKTDLLPCDPDVRLDVVPVDWVADALTLLCEHERAPGRAWHLCCGPRHALSIGAIAEIAMTAGNAWEREQGRELTPWPRIVPPDAADPDVRKLFEIAADVMRSHLPYMLREQLFDCAESHVWLRAAGLEPPPPLADYLATLVRYGLDRDFRAGPSGVS